MLENIDWKLGVVVALAGVEAALVAWPASLPQPPSNTSPAALAAASIPIRCPVLEWWRVIGPLEVVLENVDHTALPVTRVLDPLSAAGGVSAASGPQGVKWYRPDNYPLDPIDGVHSIGPALRLARPSAPEVLSARAVYSPA
ncbi:hypothetical protein GCM10017786_20790 [Amycolatopsis deserti]|uniref:Uncharacterized protein n=1 Tax=Amycolatopsis deserti TaxID=185696 RepID=A0ABQ3IMC9_9PSEU|nr:hypothetical protein GCM10017786_20790 [Amycolatopsis deserti]